MTIGYTDQSADALWLTLADGDLDLCQFPILTEATYTVPGKGVLRVGIIGASHFLSFKTEDRQFTEVLACIPDVCAEHTLVRRPLQELLGSPVEHQRDGYRFEVTAVPWDKGIGERDHLLSQIASAKSGVDEIGLLYTFPDPPDVLPAFRGCALTAVWVRIQRERISVRTLHAYPSTTMVFTTTTMGENKR